MHQMSINGVKGLTWAQECIMFVFDSKVDSNHFCCFLKVTLKIRNENKNGCFQQVKRVFKAAFALFSYRKRTSST